MAIQIEGNSDNQDSTNKTTVHMVKSENDQKAEITKNDKKEVKFSFVNHGEAQPYFG